MTRTNILRNMIFALFALIAVDLFYLQIIRGGYFARLSQNNSLRIISVDGPRGRILDRNGRILAESVKGYEVAVMPQDVKDRRALFGFLADVLKADAASLERKFDRNRANPFTPVVIADGLNREEAIVLAENAYLYPGLLVNERYRRQYPQGDAGAHILGYVGKIDPGRMQELVNNGISGPELVGYTGVEEALDDKLRGGPGGREVEVNSRGREVRVLSVREPSPGAEVALTIDERIQAAASDELSGRRGAFVMMDPSTGEVLAMVSSPAYDPNVFVDPEKRRRLPDYLTDTRSPMVNRAFGAAFTPGSVFKVPVSFAGLEEKKITPSTTFHCPGYFELGGRRFTFAHAYGDQNFIEAMAHSANEYFFYTGLMLGPQPIAEYARRFGLGERTGLDLPHETKGNIPSGVFRRGWFKGDTVNMAIGQGAVLVTPLQLARMMSAVENGGYVLRPRLIKSVGGIETSSPPALRRLVFRSDVWEAMRQALRAVVRMPTGTASGLDIDGLDIYGKTGTAQTAPGKGDHAWFAGVVRGTKRTASFCLFLEHGGSSHNAVQAVRNILLQLKEGGVI
jgi:penicillin-binding protein 2